MIFELAQHDAVAVTQLRTELGLDSGYLSRILARLKDAGLVATERSRSDARKHVACLTVAGREAYAVLDSRSADEVRSLLGRLGEAEQRRLVGAMTAIREILAGERGPEPYVLRPPLPGELGWIVEVDGEPAGCIFCMEKNETVAQLRLLLVDPRCRGLGIGARLVDECIRFARRAGYERMTPVDERRARRGQAHLRTGGLRARRGGVAPELRPRPGGQSWWLTLP